MSDVLDQLASSPAPDAPPLSASIEAELQGLTPVSPRRPLRQVSILTGLSLVYAAGLVALLTVRRDLHELPLAWIVGAALAWGLGFLVPLWLALVPRRGAVMPRAPWAAASAVVGSLAFVALGLAIHPSGPSSLDYGWAHFARGHWCLELGLATALVPVSLGALFLRGALPVGSRWVAAGLGAGGGALGGLMLHFHCRIADGLHIGLIHGGVVGVAAILSAALVPRATDRPPR